MSDIPLASISAERSVAQCKAIIANMKAAGEDPSEYEAKLKRLQVERGLKAPKSPEQRLEEAIKRRDVTLAISAEELAESPIDAGRIGYIASQFDVNNVAYTYDHATATHQFAFSYE